jgi:hypothetical protein
VLPKWENRPEITANLINPAFTSELMRASTESFKSESSNPLPFSLSIIILPLILNNKIRTVLPNNKRHTIHSWITNHEQVKIGFANNVSKFLPFSKEAIMFGIAHNSLSIDENGNLDIITRRSKYKPQDEEVKSCLNKSITLGKILAKSGNSPTIYSVLGIKP